MRADSAVGGGARTERDGAPPGGRRAGSVAAVIAGLALVLSFTFTAGAEAASRPIVSTGAANAVSYGSANLTGSLNPNGSDTSYYFQYGVTQAYGGQTTIADAGAGTHTVSVTLPVTGLQPLTVYHYRLVAVNGAGPTIGGDRTLLTTRIPLSLQILAAPNPVPFGGAVTVQGTLSGTGNANRAVVLQANTFPFAAGFQSILNPQLTLATGAFSFTVPGLTQATQYRVITATSPPVISPVAVESVAVVVSSHLGHARRAHFVRVFGTVTPAEDGAQVGVLRTVRGRGLLVGGTTLRHRDANSSSFSTVVPSRSGVYRVLVRVTNGAQISSYGQVLAIR